MKLCSMVTVRVGRSPVLKIAGGILAALGALLVIAFVPARLWLVLAGAALLAAGIWLLVRTK